MKKFLRHLLICSSALILAASCNPVSMKGFTRQVVSDHRFMPVFGAAFIKGLYELHIDYGKRNFSGIAVVKKMEFNQSYRIIMMSETGLKIFDFEFFPSDSCAVHYVMDVLNRKKIVNLLLSDLGLIMNNNPDISSRTYYKSDKSASEYIIKEKQKGKRYYHFEEVGEPPLKIYRKSMFSPSTEVFLRYNSEGIPESIDFSHKVIQLKMTFKLINDQP